MQDTTNTPAGGIDIGKLAVGVVLLLLGILAFTEAVDLWEWRQIWRYWPAFLIFIGFFSEIEALRQRKSSGGYMLMAVGVWLLFAKRHYFDLDIRSAFPLGLAVAGLGVMIHAVVDKKEEKTSHEQQ